MRTSVRSCGFALVVVLALSACGSDGSNASGSSPTSTVAETTAAPVVSNASGSSPTSAVAVTTTSPALTGEPIVLTVISERTGPAAALQMGDGAVAAAQEINAAGGIGGRPIEVKLCDTQD
ncbi:MAG: Periplasmic binding protein, partial [Mycobacterium sp.]|nr:Periplasmic binding protein [Mycobacterium sp.]